MSDNDEIDAETRALARLNGLDPARLHRILTRFPAEDQRVVKDLADPPWDHEPYSFCDSR